MEQGARRTCTRHPARSRSTPPSPETIRTCLDKVIPPIPEPPETKYIKHERILRSCSPTSGAGPCTSAPMSCCRRGSTPTRCPLSAGHRPRTFPGHQLGREKPPDPNLKPDYSERFRLPGYNRIQQEYAYQFYKDWTGAGFPRCC